MPRTNKTGALGLYRDKQERWCVDIRWREPGTNVWRRYRRRLPGSLTQKAAREQARKDVNAALSGGFEPKRKQDGKLQHALDEYIDECRTKGIVAVEKREKAAERIVGILGDMDLTSLSEIAVGRYKRARREQGVGPATINRELAVFSGMLTMAIKRKLMTRDQVAEIRDGMRLREPPGRIRHLSEDEEGRLVESLGEHMLRLVLAAVLTGMRQGELRTLKKCYLDLSQRKIVIPRPKNRKPRVVFLSENAAAIFKQATESSTCEYVFTNRERRPYSESGASHVFHEAVLRAKIDDFTFHDLRHTLATRLRRRGVGLDHLMKILGHSSLAMVMRYAHVDDEEIRASMAKIDVAQRLPNTVSTGRAAVGKS